MEFNRLLDDTRMILRFSGSSFNENHDVFSYPEEFWVELDVNSLTKLVESHEPRYFDHDIYVQKYNHPGPNVKMDLSASENVKLLCQRCSLTPCSVIDEPALEFSFTVGGTYYNFRTKVKYLEMLINKWRKL